MADEPEQEEASASAAPDASEQASEEVEQPSEQPAEEPEVDPVEQAHADHAKAHGLEPGADYAVSQHGEPVPFVGTLVGTNDLGVLIRAWGGKLASFHPWASVKSLIHQ